MTYCAVFGEKLWTESRGEVRQEGSFFLFLQRTEKGSGGMLKMLGSWPYKCRKRGQQKTPRDISSHVTYTHRHEVSVKPRLLSDLKSIPLLVQRKWVKVLIRFMSACLILLCGRQDVVMMTLLRTPKSDLQLLTGSVQ